MVVTTTTAVSGTTTITGFLRVLAGITGTSTNTNVYGTLWLDAAARWHQGTITLQTGSTISMIAHPVNGFTPLDFTGACVLGGTFRVDLNGYVPSTKVRVATFGTSVSGHFVTSINGNEQRDAFGRRLLSTSNTGNIVLEGTIAYYDPTAAANSASMSGPSMVVAVVAIVAAFFAQRN